MLALMLLATFTLASYAEDDPPITAADPASSTTTPPSTTEVAPAAIGVEGEGALKRPTFSTPTVPSIDSPRSDSVLVGPQGTQEIPRAATEEDPVAMVPPSAVPPSSDLSSYMNDDADLAGGVGTLRDFVAEGEETSPIGFQVRESRCRLKTGEELSGLLILKVEKDSPAARAGLRPYKSTTRHVLQAIAIGATMAFPPAFLATIIALPMIDYTEAGQSYDMIIGLDGSRVNRFDDFEERMHDVQPGELVYLNVVRNGKRIQLPIPIPLLSTSASN
jgi:hypothetical protein